MEQFLKESKAFLAEFIYKYFFFTFYEGFVLGIPEGTNGIMSDYGIQMKSLKYFFSLKDF